MYDELSLQRLDLVLSEAAKNGIYIILPLVNYWSDLGGMQWYVDQVKPCTPSLGFTSGPSFPDPGLAHTWLFCCLKAEDYGAHKFPCRGACTM